MPADPGVKPADLKAEAVWTLEQLKAWTAFGLAEAANVDKANGRTSDAIGIVRRCEARDREAVEKARPKFLGVF